MFEASTTNLAGGYSGTVGPGVYSGIPTNTIANDYTGLTISGNSTINYSNNLGFSTAVIPKNHMTSTQVKVAVFTIERNDKNEVISSKFVKEFWVEQKNGSSIVLAASKQLDKDFDPETTFIRELQAISF